MDSGQSMVIYRWFKFRLLRFEGSPTDSSGYVIEFTNKDLPRHTVRAVIATYPNCKFGWSVMIGNKLQIQEAPSYGNAVVIASNRSVYGYSAYFV